MAHQHQHSQEILNSTTFLLDSLYCSEERFEDQEEELIMSSVELECTTTTTTAHYTHNPNPSSLLPITLLDQDLAWEDHELATLLSKETTNHLFQSLQNDPYLSEARSEAVVWILKVVAHYCFSALTATLAVDYLDRFIVSFRFHREKPWMTQLVAVACLSLAAKVEETQVPLLLDFQVEESKYVFEAKTIKRMELLVLSTLNWKMNPVTPISFLDYIIRRLGLKDYLCLEFLKRCENIMISLIPDSRFMAFLPSIIATATMLHVVDSIEPCLQSQYQNQLLGILGIDKEKALDCGKLIMEIIACPRKRKYMGTPVPSSPNGVIDMSFSSDSSNDSWSVSSSPEALSKKTRLQTTTTNPDFLSFSPR